MRRWIHGYEKVGILYFRINHFSMGQDEMREKTRQYNLQQKHRLGQLNTW